MKQFTSKSQQTGQLGESLAVKYLTQKGYVVVERNWSSSAGEIDIIATKDSILRVIEVKSIQTSFPADRYADVRDPASNVTKGKLQRIIMTANDYIRHNGMHGCTHFIVEVVLVRFDVRTKQAQVEVISSVTLSDFS